MIEVDETIADDFLTEECGVDARFRDVGTDHARITPDGQLILSITGQVPFDFKSVLKIDPETGEVLHEPSAAYDTTRVCARLTA